MYYTFKDGIKPLKNITDIEAMRKIILYLLMFTIFLYQGLWAQSVQSGSRLNMVNKKKVAPTGTLKFTTMPSELTYKPLSLKTPTVLNSFYRSFLFSNGSTAETTAAADTEIAVKNPDKKAEAVDNEIKAEEQLYSSDKITVSNIYPNPASEYATLDYTITGDIKDAKVIFYNVLGSKMSEHALTKNNGKLRVDTTLMPTGLYFYQLSMDGKKVATKKMLVRHQQ